MVAVTATCRAVVAERRGGPEVLAVRAIRVPPPGPGEVRLRVHAAGISHGDLLMLQGLHPERLVQRLSSPRRRAPFVPGWDVVGPVEAVGAAVPHVGVGDLVAALSIVGGWAESALVSARFTVPVPAGLNPVAAVCLVEDYVVAHQMLTRSSTVHAGDAVLVQGVGGGVGTALMQVARRLGVRVLGTDRGDKRHHVESQGGVLIDFEHEDVVARCRELTGGHGVEAAYDGLGATARQSWRAVRPGGRLVWFGMSSLLSAGSRDLRAGVRTVADVAAVFSRNLRPGGTRTSLYSIQTLARRHPDWYRHDLAALLDMLAEELVRPHVAAVRALDEVPAAVAALAAGSLPGKQIIVPGAGG